MRVVHSPGRLCRSLSRFSSCGGDPIAGPPTCLDLSRPVHVPRAVWRRVAAGLSCAECHFRGKSSRQLWWQDNFAEITSQNHDTFILSPAAASVKISRCHFWRKTSTTTLTSRLGDLGSLGRLERMRPFGSPRPRPGTPPGPKRANLRKGGQRPKDLYFNELRLNGVGRWPVRAASADGRITRPE